MEKVTQGCVSVQRCDGVPEEAEGVPQLPGGKEGGGGGCQDQADCPQVHREPSGNLLFFGSGTFEYWICQS